VDIDFLKETIRSNVMWTIELQKMTKRFFETNPEGIVKKFEPSYFAVAILKGDGKIIITELEGDQVWRYDTVVAMVNDGWAVD
jgi:hypothetical protein